jgi:hypothetical protein
MVKVVTRPTSYRLCDLDGVDVLNSWHIDHLRRFLLDPLLRKICTPFVLQVLNKCFIVLLLPSFLCIAISPKFLLSGLLTSFFSYLSFPEPALSLISPHTCMGSVHYIPGDR